MSKAPSRYPNDRFVPRPEDHFTFGLWTVGNPGRDPFGLAVREVMSPVKIVRELSKLGAYGVNLHDEDLIPFDASAADRDRIVREFKGALAETGMKVPMATTNLFSQPVFREGAFTSNDSARARARAAEDHAFDRPRRRPRREDLRVLGRPRRCRDQRQQGSARRRSSASARRMNFLCEYVRDNGYDLKFALEAKPNEPRGDIFLPTTGHMLAFIYTLDHPEMVGVNPEVAHEVMAGLDFSHAVAQALEVGQALPHRSQRPEAGPLRSGPALRERGSKGGVLPGQAARGFALGRHAPLRQPPLSHRGRAGRLGLRVLQHADVPDPQGQGRALPRRHRDPRDPALAARAQPAHRSAASGRTFKYDRKTAPRSKRRRSTRRRWPRAVTNTSASTS